MPLVRGTGECIFITIFRLLNKIHWDLYKLVVVTTNEVTSMTREQHD